MEWTTIWVAIASIAGIVIIIATNVYKLGASHASIREKIKAIEKREEKTDAAVKTISDCIKEGFAKTNDGLQEIRERMASVETKLIERSQDGNS